jgi:hypothetical protein
MKDLKRVAEQVLARTLGTWKPVTADIERAYGLNEQQSRKVKQYIKALAADKGLLWGFDPEAGYLRAAPDNCPDVAQRILAYGRESWVVSGVMYKHQVRGAAEQGFVSKESFKAVQVLEEKFRSELEVACG